MGSHWLLLLTSLSVFVTNFLFSFKVSRVTSLVAKTMGPFFEIFLQVCEKDFYKLKSLNLQARIGLFRINWEIKLAISILRYNKNLEL